MNKKIENRAHLIKIMKRVFEAEEEILFAYLYGSYVHGPLLPESDIDVAIYLRPSDINKYLDIEKKILSTLIDKIHYDKIDLRILNTLPLLHQYYVLKEGIPIFIRDEQARVDFDTNVMIRYFKLKPYLEEYREMLFQRIKQEI